MRDLLIRGADLVGHGRSDLLIRDGRFIDPADVNGDVERLDADGLVALPGLVDLHTHLREPGREDAETVDSGTMAAARGGFTAVLAMANTDPVTDTAEAAVHVASLGARNGHAEVVPVGAVSKGLAGAELAELGLMARSSAGVRVFSDDGHCVADARLMRRALEYVRAFDGVIAQHAQDPQLAGPGACCHEGEISGKLGLPGWPAAAEAGVVARDVQIAELTRSRLHICHVSCAETVDVIRWAKQRGINVTAEVAPHHLMLTTSEVAGYDPTYKVNPPLRPDEHVEAVREALADGTIDAVATDHAGDRPLMLHAWTGHGAIVNSAALRALGVSETEPDPPGGLFGRRRTGALTGLAHEYADYMLRQRLTMIPDRAAQVKAFQAFAAEAASFGITSVQAMMTAYPAAEAVPWIERPACRCACG